MDRRVIFVSRHTSTDKMSFIELEPLLSYSSRRQMEFREGINKVTLLKHKHNI